MPRRWIVIIFGLLSAIAFALAVQGGNWWSVEAHEVGPFGARRCFSDGCAPTGLAWLGGTERWMRTGIATWAAGLIAVMMLVVLAGSVAAKRAPRLIAKTTLVSIVTASVTAGLFVAQFPHARNPTVELARGAGLFVIAIVLGVVSALLVLRAAREKPAT